MKAIVQRVASAKVTVNGEVIGAIGKGILAFIGICKTDTKKDVDFMARRLLNARVFEDGNEKRWAKSTSELGLEILCVSQFTLYHTMKGNKPDFRMALNSEESKTLFDSLIQTLKSDYQPSLIKEGVFGAHMVVSIENDGPVTLTFETQSTECQSCDE